MNLMLSQSPPESFDPFMLAVPLLWIVKITSFYSLDFEVDWAEPVRATSYIRVLVLHVRDPPSVGKGKQILTDIGPGPFTKPPLEVYICSLWR